MKMRDCTGKQLFTGALADYPEKKIVGARVLGIGRTDEEVVIEFYLPDGIYGTQHDYAPAAKLKLRD